MGNTFFDKARYLRALLVVLPLSLMFIILGTYNTITTPRSADAFNKVTGKIQYLKFTRNYDPYCHCKPLQVQFKIAGNSPLFQVKDSADAGVLYRNVRKGEKVSVWFDDKGQIRQVKQEDKILVPYRIGEFFTYPIAIIGVLILIVVVVYIKRHPDDLTGEK